MRVKGIVLKIVRNLYTSIPADPSFLISPPFYKVLVSVQECIQALAELVRITIPKSERYHDVFELLRLGGLDYLVDVRGRLQTSPPCAYRAEPHVAEICLLELEPAAVLADEQKRLRALRKPFGLGLVYFLISGAYVLVLELPDVPGTFTP